MEQMGDRGGKDLFLLDLVRPLWHPKDLDSATFHIKVTMELSAGGGQQTHFARYLMLFGCCTWRKCNILATEVQR